MSIQSTQLTTTVGNVFVSNNPSGSAVTVIYFCNTSASPAAVSVHAVPNGGSASDTNKIYSNVGLITNDTFVVSTERLLLDNGDMIQAVANINSAVSVTISTASL